MSGSRGPQHAIDSSNLADLLERVLDKGVVIAGDIRVKLVDIELLTIQIRLVICSVDKAKEMGMDWWANQPIFSSGKPAALAEPAPVPGAGDAARVAELEDRLRRLEAELAARPALPGVAPATPLLNNPAMTAQPLRPAARMPGTPPAA